MDGEATVEQHRPSWLLGPCPEWCTRAHHEDDHPEDRIHQDDGVSFPAVVAHIDPHDLRRVPVASEIVVQRSQAAVGEPTVWLFIGEAETANRMMVAAGCVADLCAALT